MKPLLVDHPIMAGLVAKAEPEIAALEKYFASQIALVKSGPAGEAKAQQRGSVRARTSSTRSASGRGDRSRHDQVRQGRAERAGGRVRGARTQLLLLGASACCWRSGIAWLITRSSSARSRS